MIEQLAEELQKAEDKGLLTWEAFGITELWIMLSNIPTDRQYKKLVDYVVGKGGYTLVQSPYPGDGKTIRFNAGMTR